MFYEERVIDGKLYFRNDPTGNWELITYDLLLAKYLDYKRDYNYLLGVE